MSPDKWKQMNITPQELKSSNPESKAENWATYRAMRYAIDNPVVAEAPKTITNESKKMQMQHENRMAYARFNKAANEQLAKLKKSWKDKGDQEQKATMGQFVDNLVKNAQSKPAFDFIDESGQSKQLYSLPNMPSIRKALETTDMFGKKVQPEQIAVDKDGNVYSVFYEREIVKDKEGKSSYTGKYATGKSKGRVRFDKNLTSVIDKNILIAELSKEMLTPSKVELIADDDEPSSTAPNAPSEPTNVAELDDL
jgi:hypothetical protein